MAIRKKDTTTKVTGDSGPYVRTRARQWMITDHFVQPVRSNLIHDDDSVIATESYGEALKVRYFDLLENSSGNSLGGLEVRYFCGQIEVAPETGKVHGQLYISFVNQQDFGVVKRFLSQLPDGGKLHIEAARGTAEQAIQYCTKTNTRIPGDDSRWEWGGTWAVMERSVFDRSYYSMEVEARLFAEAEKCMSPALAVEELVRWNLFRILDEDPLAPGEEGEGEDFVPESDYEEDIDADVQFTGRFVAAAGAAASAAAAAAGDLAEEAFDRFAARDLGLEPVARVLFADESDQDAGGGEPVVGASPLRRTFATAKPPGAPRGKQPRSRLADRD